MTNSQDPGELALKNASMGRPYERRYSLDEHDNSDAHEDCEDQDKEDDEPNNQDQRRGASGPAPLSRSPALSESPCSSPYPFPGVLADGSYAPTNSDAARLDWLARNPGVLRNLKAGVYVTTVKNQWQASVRAALDAAMETKRRELRANGLNPVW